MPNNTYIHFKDVSNQPLISKKVVFQSINPPTVSSSYLAVGDSVSKTTDANGYITASLIPTNYHVEISNPLPATSFYGSVDANGSFSAISASIKTGNAPSVVFNLIDILSNPFEVKKLNLTPVTTYPYVFSGSVICLNTVSKTTDTSGIVNFAEVIPGIVQVDAIGKSTTTFYISVPNSGSSLNAKDLLVVKPSKGIAIKLSNSDKSYVLTVSASDARYVNQGGSIDSASFAQYAVSASYAPTPTMVQSASYMSGSTVITKNINVPDTFHTNDAHDFIVGDVGYEVLTVDNVEGWIYLNYDSGTQFISTEEGAIWNPNGDLLIDLNENKFNGTASYAIKALSASYAPSNGTSLTTASTYPITASWSNNAISASWAPDSDSVSASYFSGSVVSASAASINRLVIPDVLQAGPLEFTLNNGSSTLMRTDFGAGGYLYINYADGNTSCFNTEDGALFDPSGNTVIDLSGHLFYGTSSYADRALSSSYAITSSYAKNAGSASNMSGSMNIFVRDLTSTNNLYANSISASNNITCNSIRPYSISASAGNISSLGVNYLNIPNAVSIQGGGSVNVELYAPLTLFNGYGGTPIFQITDENQWYFTYPDGLSFVDTENSVMWWRDGTIAMDLGSRIFYLDQPHGQLMSASINGTLIKSGNGALNLHGEGGISATIGTGLFQVASDAGINLFSYGTINIDPNNGHASTPTEKIYLKGDTTITTGSLTITSGSVSFQSIATKTGNYTLTNNDYTVMFSASSALTASLPSAVGIKGRIYNIKKVGTGNVYISGSQTIDGASSQTITTQYQTLHLQSDNAQWWTI